MPLKTRTNSFGRHCTEPPPPDDPTCPECYDGQIEFCVRMCWVDDCPLDWDLWVRDRNEDSGNAWASYLNLGPVGETSMELNEDVEKPSNVDYCGDIVSPCGLSEGADGYAGEMTCACMDGAMTFPKIFDVVVNLFGNDQGECSFTLGDVCLQYFCDSALIANSTQTITNVVSGSGSAAGGNFGISPYKMLATRFNDATCSPEFVGTSTCWVITSQRKGGKLFLNRGPGRAPTRFVIPDDADPGSCVLYEDGVLVPRNAYKVVHETVATKTGLETATYGTKGQRRCGKKADKKKKPCRGCKKKKKKTLF